MTLPPPTSAQEWSSPLAMAVAPVTPLAAVGTVASAVVPVTPVPIWPCMFRPQHFTVPS